MQVTQAPQRNSRILRFRPTVALVLAVAMLLAGLAFSIPSASAGPNGARYNGGYEWYGEFVCKFEPAVPSTADHKGEVHGTAGDDVIIVLDPSVVAVYGHGGDDIICVDVPGAVIDAGAGRDYVYSADLPDDWDSEGSLDHPAISTIYGGPGNDVIRGGSGWDNISGGDGHDLLHGGDGFDYLWGGPGRDLFDGGPNNAPPGSFPPTGPAGDRCNDFESPLGDFSMACEELSLIADTDSPEMPETPEPGMVTGGCSLALREPICPGFSHFR